MILEILRDAGAMTLVILAHWGLDAATQLYDSTLLGLTVAASYMAGRFVQWLSHAKD